MVKALLRGPVVLVLVLLLVYAAFLVWYGGNGRKMTPVEASLLISRLQSQASPSDAGRIADGRILQYLRTLAASDDGREFYMLYLMQMRADDRSAAGSLDADARNNTRLLPLLLRHGHVPVFVGEPQGHFIQGRDDRDWHRVVIVRYRSRRDLLEMMAEVAGQPIGVLRWAAMEHQQVLPIHARISLFFGRGIVAMALALLGFVLHFLLRNWSLYRGSAAAPDDEEAALRPARA